MSLPHLLVAACLAVLSFTSTAPAAEDDVFIKTVKPFLIAHCIKCHGPEKPKGDLRLDNLSAVGKESAPSWEVVRDQIRDGLMPPLDQPRPDRAEAGVVVVWATAASGARPSRLPNQGNLIPHELLFGSQAESGDAPPARLWRIGPGDYMGFVHGLLGGKTGNGAIPGITQPFVLVNERGIRDFAGLYSIDEPSTDVLLRNAATIVNYQTGPRKNNGPNSIPEFAALVNAADPSRPQLESAVRKQLLMAIGRAPADEEISRYLALYEKAAKDGDKAGAIKTMLQAVLLKSDAIFRSEIGGKPDGTGRALLTPLELAQALSQALGHRRDPGLFEAAQKGTLTTREQVADQVKRLLADAKADKSRIMNFFHEYFEYHKADEVFKDKPRDFVHSPRTLIGDTDRLVAHILAEDKDVFRRLLTTPESFVNYTTVKEKKTGKEVPQQAVSSNNNNKGQAIVDAVYGVKEWSPTQPVSLPSGTRIGILMQPSWLVAWSTNFDNDPVRRGRWVRERLLGGTVPELPIGVAAQVPEDPHRTFRDRLTVTRAATCWKCHQKMDDLGLPFEQFDHFGRFRTTEDAPDPKAPLKKTDKGKFVPTMISLPLDTTGLIAESGDPQLDGPVNDPREMIRKIADSDLARQVFVRHAFRYFMGRNETLADARSLQEADKAYLSSGGSFNALIVSLLTSDAYLYRTPAKQPPADGGPK